ncbi:MAG: Tol-Pal system beta propeller repeat protein TolB, partial [Nitrospinota bacterium]
GRPLGIAIPPFNPDGVSGPELDYSRQIVRILTHDLQLYGFFAFVKNETFLREASAADAKAGQIVFKEWAEIGAQMLVKGSYQVADGQVVINARLFDVDRGLQITGRRYTGPPTAIRLMVHKFADEIIYRLTGEPGIAQTKIAFTSRQRGNKEIFIMDYDGHNPQQVTADRTIALNPAWSPNGRFIAYTSYRERNPDLFVMDWTGWNKRVLSRAAGLNAAPAWHPDGQRLAVVMSLEGDTEIYVVRVDGQIVQRLTRNRRIIDTSPTWSPNGRQLAFVSDRSGTPQIYVMDADGTNIRRLTFEGAYNADPVWSPKGDRIAFVSRRDGPFDVYTMNPDGTGVIQLTSGQGSNESPAWSPDGRYLVFSSTRARGIPDLYLMRADGSAQRRLTYLAGGGSDPVWSPRLE